MYKGLAQLVGMDIVGKPQTLDEQMTLLEQNWSKYDFFFIHFKYTDSTGEDGNFAAKVKRTEEFDAAVPRIMALKPDVFIVTGDHSTPSMLKSHSWHPVPTLLVGQKLPHRRLPEIRRKRMPPRRPRPVRSQVPHDARPGQRRPAGQVRRVRVATRYEARRLSRDRDARVNAETMQSGSDIRVSISALCVSVLLYSFTSRASSQSARSSSSPRSA